MCESESKINQTLRTLEKSPDDTSGHRTQFSPEEQQRCEQLFKTHWKWVLWKAQSAGVSDPESLAAATLAKAIVTYLPERASFRTWLSRLLKFTIIDAWRLESRRREILQEFFERTTINSGCHRSEIEDYEHRDWLQAALAQIPVEDCELILAYYENEKSIREIAENI